MRDRRAVYDLIPPTACFCGCGRSMSFGRVQTVNGAAMCLRADVDMLSAAAGRAPRDEAVAGLLADAEPLLDMLRGILHGDRPADALDRAALRGWWQRALPVRDRVQDALSPADRTGAGERRYTPRQLAMLHELGALSEMQVWGRMGMAR